jgi:hypothetical protein
VQDESLSRSSLLFAHDLFGKPVSTFFRIMLLNRDVVDQPGGAKPGGHQDAQRPVFD